MLADRTLYHAIKIFSRISWCHFNLLVGILRQRIIHIHVFLLAYLRPSRELLEYYRKKIAEFDSEHDDMVHRLDNYKMTYEEQVSEKDQFKKLIYLYISLCIYSML